jgi:uncharacterized RDD family membrane protein YckC
MITPVMIARIGWGTYLFFAAWNAIFIPVIWFFYPETSGRSLEEIDLIFATGVIMTTVKLNSQLLHVEIALALALVLIGDSSAGYSQRHLHPCHLVLLP